MYLLDLEPSASVLLRAQPLQNRGTAQQEQLIRVVPVAVAAALLIRGIEPGLLGRGLGVLVVVVGLAREGQVGQAGHCGHGAEARRLVFGIRVFFSFCEAGRRGICCNTQADLKLHK